MGTNAGPGESSFALLLSVPPGIQLSGVGFQTPIPLSVGGGLLQRGLPGAGKLGDSLTAGKDPEGLEEAGSNEDLLFRCCGPCKLGRPTRGAAWLRWGDLPLAPAPARVADARCAHHDTTEERPVAALRGFLARFKDLS